METINAFQLPVGDPELKKVLNFNPWHNKYTKTQVELGRNPDETDRGGWRGYNRVYSKYLSNMRNEKLNILEIGVHSGYSLIGWARYFPNSFITGVEIDEKWLGDHVKLQMKHEEFLRINVKYFDSTKKADWLFHTDSTDKFDIIIDDGSHQPKDQVATIELALDKLAKNGYYFIEDISKRYLDVGLIWQKLGELEEHGYIVEAFSHYNQGWAAALSKPELWNKFGITKDTPKAAEDYIVAIHKVNNE